MKTIRKPDGNTKIQFTHPDVGRVFEYPEGLIYRVVWVGSTSHSYFLDRFPKAFAPHGYVYVVERVMSPVNSTWTPVSAQKAEDFVWRT